MKYLSSCLLFLLSAFLSPIGFAQDLSLADYERADAFRWVNLQKKVFFLEVRPNWLADGSGFWFLTNSPTGKRFQTVHLSSKKISPSFDHNRLAQLLQEELEEKISGAELPFNRINLKEDGIVEFELKGVTYHLDTHTDSLSSKENTDPHPSFEATSPDGNWVAFVKNYNLFIRSIKTGEEFQLSTDGTEHYQYASYYGWYDKMEGEMGKRPQRFWVSWSPDSRHLLTQITDTRSAQKMYLLDWSVDTLYRPRLLSYFRGSPGDTNIVYNIPCVFNIPQRTKAFIDLPPAPHFNPIQLEWMNRGKDLLGIYNERGYKAMRFIHVNPNTGTVSTLYTEKSPTNVKSPSIDYGIAGNYESIFFTSESSGWNQLYAYDIDIGETRALTTGEFVVNRIVKVDTLEEKVYFLASGREEGRNPYFAHVYSLGFDGKKLRLLSPEDAHHEVSFSQDGKYFVDNYSSLNQATRSVLRRAKDGKILMEISRADFSTVAGMGWQSPEPFVAKARDGKTDIYGAIWKPSHFDPNKKYPVIDHSYTGPHTQVFPKSFAQSIRSSKLPLAELGFVVVAIDGLGSSGRSKAFHDWSYKQMGFSLLDHKLAIQQLGERYPWIDTERVGIYGHSAGGYDAAHALLQFPGFYKVAVSSSADHDHRMEKAWWPEKYMGWPVDTAYHNQSNITMAKNLTGKLLITHGGLDDNVNPSASFKLAEALVQAGKEFDMLIFPSQRHGYRGKTSDYFTKKRWNYFVEHLLGTTPIWEYELISTQ